MGSYFIKGGKSTFIKNCVRWMLTPIQASIASVIVLLHRNRKSSYKYEVTICGLFKNEGRFLREWMDFHIAAGVEHFYMYNNNSDDNYLEVLEPFVKQGIAEIIDWPQPFPQMPAYRDCYEKRRHEAKWIGYIDIDEFVCPKYDLIIRSWLDRYKKFPSVLIYWKSFGTAGRLRHDDQQYVIEQYTSAFEKLMDMGKVFINTSYRFEEFKTPHLISAQTNVFGMKFNIPPVNEYKIFVCFGLHRVPLFNRKITIQLNHYWSKALEIFIYNKTQRSDVYSKENEEIDKYILLNPNEKNCITRDYAIQRYLLDLRLMEKKRNEQNMEV
jgi:Glycosyltransferase family 92